MMETIQEILNFSVGKLTVGNIISALVIFLVCHAVIKALMGPIERLLDKPERRFDAARFSTHCYQSSAQFCRCMHRC